MFELVELLTQVNSRILRTLSPLVKANNVTFSELIILWKINKRGSCTSTDLAAVSSVPASTLTSVLDRLEAKGLVARSHDAQDRRCILIQGTPKLRHMLADIVAQADSELQTLFRSLSPEFLARFSEDLDAMNQHLLRSTGDTNCILP
jgi:DNA-binding MarR family transcriptional regulator